MSSNQNPMTPTEGAEDVTSAAAAPSKKSRTRSIFIIGLVLLAACSLYLWTSYLTTRRPLSDSLPVAQVAAEVIKPRYLFSIYGIIQPLGIAVSPDGSRIYVGESGGERLIHVFDKDGKEQAKFTAPGATINASAPVSLSIDDQGRLFAADALRHTVDIYDAGGNYKKSIQPPQKEGWVPIGLAVEGKTLLVAGRNESMDGVFAMTLDGQLQFQFGQHGEEARVDGFYSPGKALTDARGRLYVSDTMNGRVAIFDKDRKFLDNLLQMNHAKGMAIDEGQRLYVVDTIDQMVKVFDVSGTGEPSHLFDFGDFGIGDGQFNFPNDIAIDGQGRLYITDRASNRVQVWTY